MKLAFITKIGLAFLIAGVLFQSCSPPDYPSLDKTIPLRIADLAGTWRASKVVQYDQQAIDNAYPVSVQSMDITNAYAFSQYTLTLNLDTQNRPTTYTVTPGTAPNFLALTEGNWSVDHPVFVTKLDFFQSNSTSSGRFVVKSIEKDKIILRMQRKDADATNTPTLLYYEYEFTR